MTGVQTCALPIYSERDRWFTAEQAKDYGLVDKVIVKRGEIR